MKFARYLEENTIPEWKKVYIEYRGLKKLIKRVAEHRELRLRLEHENAVSFAPPSSSALSNTPANSTLRHRSTPVAAPSHASGSAQSPTRNGHGSAIRADAGESAPILPAISLKGTGLRLRNDPASTREAGASELDLEAQPTLSHPAPPPAPHPSHPASAPVVPSITTVFPPPTSNDRRMQQKQSQSPTDAPANPRNRPTMLGRAGKATSDSRLRHRKSRSHFPITLEELIREEFDPEERKIFSATDAELEKVVSFYAAREMDAAHKYTQLARQLKELADHRREYRARNPRKRDEKPASKDAATRFSGYLRDRFRRVVPAIKLDHGHPLDAQPRDLPHPDSPQGQEDTPVGSSDQSPKLSAGESLTLAGVEIGKTPGQENQTEDLDEGDRRRAKALAQMQLSLKGWDEETDKAIRLANKAAALNHNPQAYLAARKKLKAAVLEYYKFLETLSNYKILNRNGFAKIMKKLSKSVDVPCAEAYYEARVAPTILVTSHRIENLSKATEEIFAAYFEHGNRKEAINRLRAREDHTSHHFSVFRSGIYLGVALCATVAGLIEANEQSTHERVPQWQGLLRVYGAEFIPTLFALLFGLNLAWWHQVRINTVFIFEWDVRNTMDRHQFFEMPALLMLLLSLCFWLSFLDSFSGSIPATTWPTVWLVIVLVAIFNPLPFMLRPSRIWFVKSMLRVFSGGYKRVEFRDFFLGDELNSVAWSISNLWYFGCQWKHDWAIPDRCSPNSTYWTAVLLAVPAVLRLGQCIRRWVDSDCRTHLHLVNGAKYTSAILQFFTYIHWRKNGELDSDKALWIVFAVIFSVFHISWDLTMDWSLLKPRARYWLLRDEVNFPVAVYYLFMVVDVVLRFSWTIYLIPGGASVLLRSFVVALLEMMRRVCWNNLRVENEQIGNTDSFKIIRDLPLPYRQRQAEAEAEDDVDDEDVQRRGGMLSSVRLDVLRSRSRRLAPGAGAMTRPSEGIAASASASASASATGTGTGDTELTRTKTVLNTLRDTLVPDTRHGRPLDERAVTKGKSGRDYEPRQIESDSDDDEDDEDDEEGASTPVDPDSDPYRTQ